MAGKQTGKDIMTSAWSIVVDSSNPPFSIPRVATVTVGPFTEYDKAEAFARMHFRGCEWDIVPSYLPRHYYATAKEGEPR